jgi:hypothetical protein
MRSSQATSRAGYLSSLACAFALTAAGVEAAVDTPRNAGEFATHCSQARPESVERGLCRAQIYYVDALAMSSHKRCSFLGKRDQEENLKAVLTWLAQHPETHGLSVDDGIIAALEALWRCEPY